MKLTRKELAQQLRQRTAFEIQSEEAEQLRAWCRWFGKSEKGTQPELYRRVILEMWKKEYRT